ncbi:hypothetical protein QM565_18555, partial [Geitlerinema splendidum]|nr:hypothetical protein [Geitlerinema splendidum]
MILFDRTLSNPTEPHSAEPLVQTNTNRETEARDERRGAEKRDGAGAGVGVRGGGGDVDGGVRAAPAGGAGRAVG